MLPKFRNTAIAAVAAVSMISTAAVPAHAWGEKEQNLLTGLTAAAIVGTLIMKNRNRQPAATQQHYQPRYQAPRQTYTAPARYQEPQYPSTYQSGIYATPAAQAFNSLSASERRTVQSRLANWGYYQGGIDGSFGPQTYRAVTTYAGDTSGTNQLSTVAGAYNLYSSLIR